MSAVLPILRPNTISVDRRIPGAQSATGSQAANISRVNSSIPALIDFDHTSREEWLIDGVVFVQDATVYLDGLRPYQFAGTAAGGTVTIGGIAYVVATNARGAYPSVQRGDRITDQDGGVYLVLSVATYYDAMPALEARLAAGRPW